MYLYTNATLQQLGLELSTCYGLWLRIPWKWLDLLTTHRDTFLSLLKIVKFNKKQQQQTNKQTYNQSLNQSNKQIKQNKCSSYVRN